jgi:hypothetical protein
VANHIDTGYINSAFAGWQRTAQHANRRGLSRTIRSKQAEYLPTLQCNVHMIHGHKSAKALDYTASLDNRVVVVDA